MFDEFLRLRRTYGGRESIKRRFELWKNRYIAPSTEQTVLGDLRALGIATGDLVMVHSAFSRIGYLRGGPQAFISALQTAVGPDGTIMMPAFPHLGGTFEYVQRNELFDVANTPVAIGQLQEAFRTTPDTVRSLHPTHSCTAWGKHASELIRDHHIPLNPFGPGTPLYRFVEAGGKRCWSVSDCETSLVAASSKIPRRTRMQYTSRSRSGCGFATTMGGNSRSIPLFTRANWRRYERQMLITLR